MDPFVGQIQVFGCNFAPIQWAQCNGQILPIAQNTALFSLLGTFYGGNGTTNFALPNLQGSSMVHTGQGPGLSPISTGEVGGSYSVTLNTNNLPPHTHAVAVKVNSAQGEEADPTLILASSANEFTTNTTPVASLGGVNQVPVGQNQPFAITNPYLGLNACIALQGVYPARN